MIEALATKLGVDISDVSLLLTLVVGFGSFLVMLIVGTTCFDKKPAASDHKMKKQQAAKRDPNAKYACKGDPDVSAILRIPLSA